MPKAIFHFDSHQISVDAPSESLISDTALLADIVLNTKCGGHGLCNGCAVDLISGEFRSVAGEILRPAPGRRIRAMACQTIATSQEFTVFVPHRSLVETGEKVLIDFDLTKTPQPDPPLRVFSLELPAPELEDSAGHFERICRQLNAQSTLNAPVRASLELLRNLPSVFEKDESNFKVSTRLVRASDSWELIDVCPAGVDLAKLALAIDIGTTTVVVALVDLSEQPKIIDAVSSYNQQISCSADVAARISFASSAGRLAQLRRLIVDDTINRLIGLLLRNHNLEPRDIPLACVAGNTVMTHLFLGLDPTSIGRVPFEPIAGAPGPLTGAEIGLKIHPRGRVDILPAIAAYVGPDITANLLLCGTHQANDLSLMIDIGTNAELCLGSKQGCWACATPAGPAFEGAGLTFGMRASAGAIESLTIDPETLQTSYQVIGDEKPVGICGSALIDFLAEGLRSGMLNKTGRINPDLINTSPYVRRTTLSDKSQVTEFILVQSEQTEDAATDIVITEKDIEALLQAKAVIFAGISILLKNVDKEACDLHRVYLAGAFARHINLANAVTIGLLPDILLDRYHFIGNGSLGGAFLALVDSKLRAQANELIAAPEVIQLNLDPDFMDQYTFAMFLPHMDEDLFPRVQVD